MNGIDDEFIEEALTYERSKKRKPSCVLRIVLVAALISVLLVHVGAGVLAIAS